MLLIVMRSCSSDVVTEVHGNDMNLVESLARIDVSMGEDSWDK